MNWNRIAPVRWLVLWLLRALVVANRDPDMVILDGQGRPYLLRWYIGRRRDDGSWYLHRMIAPDVVKDPHSHPWGFQTWVLSGGYMEAVWVGANWGPAGEVAGATPRLWRRTYDEYLDTGDHRSRPPWYKHVIEAVSPNTWTLVRTGKRDQNWGFYSRAQGVFTPWQDYLARNTQRTAE
jgi:hypothetical protein